MSSATEITILDHRHFLPDKGLMADLIRHFDWSRTALGPMKDWPQSLKTTLSICLYAETPSLLLVGKEFILIYNDAYIPVLGEKHPDALARSARKIWSDTWSNINEMVQKVIKEKKTYYLENLLVKLHRNEHSEETYFSFSYIPVVDEFGLVAAVYAPVTDTTNEVIGKRRALLLSQMSNTIGHSTIGKVFKQAVELISRYDLDFPLAAVFEVLPGSNLIRYEAGTKDLEKVFGKNTRLDDKSNLGAIISQALKSDNSFLTSAAKLTDQSLPKGGWDKSPDNCLVIPLHSINNGKSLFVCFLGINPYLPLSDQHLDFYKQFGEQLRNEVLSLNKLEVSRIQGQQLQHLFLKAPIAICMLKGSEFNVELANESMLELWGKSRETMLNKPLFVGMPDARGQGFEDLLQNVFTTGQRHVSQETSINLVRHGESQNVFVKFVYEAIFESDGSISGVMAIAEEITDQVNARQLLEEHGTMLLNILKQAPAAMATFIGKDLIFESANTLFMTLAEGRAIIGLPARKAIPEFGEQGIWDIFEKVYETGQPFIGEEFKIEINHKAGEPENLYFNFVIQPIKDNSGKLSRILLHSVDVTGMVRSRQQIEELQTRQKLAIEAANIGTFEWKIAQSQFLYSERLARIFGFKEDHGLVQKSFGDRIHPEDQKTRMAAHQKAFETGTLFYEARVIWPDESIHWVRLNGKVVYDEKGNPDRMYGTSLDITDQKALSEELERQVKERTMSLSLMNEDLKRSEERYHKMTEEVQDYAILLLDTDGYILNWNKGAQRIKGYSESEIISKNFRTFYSAADRKDHLPERLLEQARTTGRATQEGWRIRKDGTAFWASVVITALHDDKNNVIGFSKVTRDLTERKEAEEKMQQYLIDLENQNRELEQFAYVASHDLQEPLRKIRTFSDLVRNNLDNKEFAARYFEKIDNSAQRMTDLIRSILNYSRLSVTKDEFVDVALQKVLNGVLTDLELLIQEKGAVITYDPLPDVKGIQLQLHQLFLNLIGNAIKFSSTKPLIHISHRIMASTEIPKHSKVVEGKKYHQLIFKDNGIGFEQKYAEQVFTIFQRLHTKDAYSGTGIGLALCRRVVENHHGIITVRSEPGKGTEFFVYLPVN